MIYFKFPNFRPVEQKSKNETKKSQEESQNGTLKSKIAEQGRGVGTRKKSLRSYANQENQHISNGNANASEHAAGINDNKPGSR